MLVCVVKKNLLSEIKCDNVFLHVKNNNVSAHLSVKWWIFSWAWVSQDPSNNFIIDFWFAIKKIVCNVYYNLKF